MNLGPKTTAELADVGISSVEDLLKIGWQEALKKIGAKYPHRLNLNMARALIGACLNLDWRKISPEAKAEARELIQSLKPAKPREKSPLLMRSDKAFLSFIIEDRLSRLHITTRRLFGGQSLYADGSAFYFGFICGTSLYLKTDSRTAAKFIAHGMDVFQPTPAKTLKGFYEVPQAILEDEDELLRWALEANACD